MGRRETFSLLENITFWAVKTMDKQPETISSQTSAKSLSWENAADRPVIEVHCPLCGRLLVLREAVNLANVKCGSCGFGFPLDRPLASSSLEIEAWSLEGPAPLVEKKQLRCWLRTAPRKRNSLKRWDRFGQWAKRSPRLVWGAIASVLLLVLATGLIHVGFRYHRDCLALADHHVSAAENRCLEAERLVAEKEQLVRERERLAQKAKEAQKLAEQERLEADRKRVEAETKRTQLEREGHMVLALELLEDSRRRLSDHPTGSLFQASRSLQTLLEEGKSPSTEQEQLIRDALAMLGGKGLPGEVDGVKILAVSPNGRFLAAGGEEKMIRLWDLKSDRGRPALRELKGHEGWVRFLTFLPNGKRLVSAGHDGTVRIWDIQDDEAEPVVLRGARGRISSAAVSRDGRWLLTGGSSIDSDDHAARLWDLREENLEQVSPVLLRGHRSPIHVVAISPNGRWAITAGEDKTVRLYDLTASHPAAEQIILHGHEGWITSVAVSPDSRTLFTGSYDGTMRAWDLSSPDPFKKPIVLRGHQGWVVSIAVSPNGRWLATGSYDKSIRLYDLGLPNWEKSAQTLDGHDGRIRQVLFSPDSECLVSASFDKTVRLWDLRETDPSGHVQILRGHRSPVSTVGVSPDGNWLASGAEPLEGEHHRVRIWDLTLDSLLDSARQAASSLSEQERCQLIFEAVREGEKHLR